MCALFVSQLRSSILLHASTPRSLRSHGAHACCAALRLPSTTPLSPSKTDYNTKPHVERGEGME
ncbi:MAG: hypothetical protein K2F62_07365 [Muribaculaceae bacterium]|nr:hypothetical protein [Muribaculaceae bacterium]